jgi:hypothetical protein
MSRNIHSSGRSDIVDIACEIRAETECAVQVSDGTIKVWLPKSLVEIEDGAVAIPEWLALERGLI